MNGANPNTRPPHEERTPISKLSRRRMLTLLGTGGTAAAVAATTVGRGALPEAIAQEATPTASPEALPQPAAGRLHAKPILEPFFIPHGTSVEMRWTPDATREYLMSANRFFIRNHSATPIIDEQQWRLTVDGPGVDEPLELTYQDLLSMPATTVTRFVECAGNGRGLYDLVLGEPAEGTQWITGGYGVGTWTGVSLSAILEQAGLNDSAVSIMASGLDESGFEKPLPIEKAMAEDTMVVYGMNYGPLPHDHGFPVRLLVPGWVGSYNIKWLGSLHVGDEQLYSRWNTSSYVLIGPEYSDPEGPPEGEIIREQTIKSIVALPWGATLPAGRQRIVGYAWSPYAAIAKVEVSLDNGETFQPADLMSPNIAAAGSRWEYTLDAEPGEMTILTRATDTQGNTQWPVSEQVWNEKGYVWGALIPHPVTFAEEQAAEIPGLPTAQAGQGGQTGPSVTWTPAPIATATPAAGTTADATATPTAAAQETPTPGASPTPEATPTGEATPMGGGTNGGRMGGGQTAGTLAQSGSQVYAEQCAVCHGEQGGGGTGPAVIGQRADLSNYDTARGLYNYIRSAMPQDNPGSLTDQQYLESLAHMLVENGYVSADQPLTFDNLAEIPLE